MQSSRQQRQTLRKTPRAAWRTKKDSSSKFDVEKLKQVLSKTMSDREVVLVTNIFKKFHAQSTDKERFNGFVSTLHLERKKVYINLLI